MDPRRDRVAEFALPKVKRGRCNLDQSKVTHQLATAFGRGDFITPLKTSFCVSQRIPTDSLRHNEEWVHGAELLPTLLTDWLPD